jgi:pyridine nucleotide-disulfide oxidoreductase family protein
MKRLLLAGGGQAHVFVLRELARKGRDLGRDVEVVLVTPHERLLYSGMLPGWIAGHYALADLTIPLAPLAAAAGARLVSARVAGLDLERRVAFTDTGAALPFDWMSIATGPVIDFDAIAGAADYALPLRPLENFVAGWERIQRHVLTARETVRATIIGAGAGGCEIALAIAHRMQTSPIPLRVQLLTGDAPILPGHSAHARRLMHEALLAAGVRLIEAVAQQIEADTVVLEGGSTLASDVTLLITGAAAPAWPATAGLATDERGFIAVNEKLQSTSHPFIFAAGDVATLIDHPRPKSGVYAVRAGPPLAANVLAALAGQRLGRYRPQRRALYLLATGPQHAIASWGPLAWAGNWVWRWKDRIDRAYVSKFRLS